MDIYIILLVAFSASVKEIFDVLLYFEMSRFRSNKKRSLADARCRASSEIIAVKLF